MRYFRIKFSNGTNEDTIDLGMDQAVGHNRRYIVGKDDPIVIFRTSMPISTIMSILEHHMGPHFYEEQFVSLRAIPPEYELENGDTAEDLFNWS